MDLFIPEFFHSSAELSQKIREVSETTLIKNQLTVKVNNRTGSDPDEMGAEGIKCPTLLPICVFPLGSKPLRNDHTHTYCSFCLLSSRIQTPAPVCAVRGAVAPFGRVSAFTGVLWLVSASLYSFSILPKGLI